MQRCSATCKEKLAYFQPRTPAEMSAYGAALRNCTAGCRQER
jgi:hypothetical protein